MLRRAYRPLVTNVTLLLLAAMSLMPAAAGAYQDDEESHPFASEHFDERWERTDQPVAAGEVERTWMWEPEPYTGGMQEPYLDSPSDTRLVQYFDKSRMEITHPDAFDDGL